MSYYSNRGDLHRVYKDSSRDIDHLIMILSFSLNKVHGVDHGFRYWNIVLRSWVRFVVENYYHNLLMNNDHEYLQVGKFSFDVPSGYNDFANQIVTVDWRDRFAMLISYLDNNSIKNCFVLKKNTKLPCVNRSYKYFILLFLSSLSRIIPSGKLLSTNFISPSLFLNAFIKLRMIPIPIVYRDEIVTTSINLDMRNELYKIGQIKSEGIIGDRLWKLVCAIIPLSYLEDYWLLVKSSARQYGKAVRIVLSNDLHGYDGYKVWVAKSVESGTKLVGVQHGGGYGISFYSDIEHHEISVSDLYLTWFSSKEKNTIQVPAYKYIYKKNNPDNLSVVIVNVSYPGFYKYTSGPIMEQVAQNIDDQLMFLSLLNNETIRHVSIRQYPYDYEFPVKEKYKLLGFDALVDNSPDYNSLISNASLVILSYRGTAWLETLMNNIPTVVFVNPDHWDVRQEVAPYLDQLKKVGILYDSPSSAANHVNNICPNISSWWNDQYLQSVRSEFCRSFGYTEKEWPEKWVESISKLVD